MPEQSSIELAQGVVLTPEDERNISELFDECDVFSCDRDYTSVAGRIVMQEFGEKAVSYLIQIIEQADDKRKQCKAIKLLQFCVSPADIIRVSNLLERDDIGGDNVDRSNKCSVLRTLIIYGTFESYQDVVNFARRSFEIMYDIDSREVLQTDDIYMSLRALFAIQGRTENIDQKQTIADAIESIFSESAEHGHIFTSEEIESIQTYNEFLIERHKILFETIVYDGESESSPGNEFEEDDSILDEYQTLRCVDIESRLETVRRLRHEAAKCDSITEEPEHSDDKFLRRHWLEYRETHPSPYAPTLGIEIEIREHTVMTPEERDMAKHDVHEDDFVARIITEKRRPYKRAQELGVPAGYDAFWEFAHKPVRYYHTLSREVQALIQMGLINTAYKKHSLHMTIGDITSRAPHGDDVFTLARALEATGWSTSGGRLIRDYLTKGHGGWAIKGFSGVQERHSSEIQLGSKTAVEIRTFQLQSIAGLERMLRSSFFLGAALKAHQRVIKKEQVDDKEVELSKVWEEFVFVCKQTFFDYNLKNPSEKWDEPCAEDEGEFGPLADLLDMAYTNPKSKGAEFVKEIRMLIIKTRAQIKEIMYENEQHPNLADTT